MKIPAARPVSGDVWPVSMADNDRSRARGTTIIAEGDRAVGAAPGEWAKLEEPPV